MVEIVRSLHAEMTRVLEAPICFFGLYDAPGQSVEVIWQTHDGVELTGGSFPLASGPTSQAVRTCEPQLIRRWSRDGPRVQVQYATDRPGLPESAITVPVVFDDRVVGVLSVQSYRPDEYDADDLLLVQGIAEQAAIALAAAEHGSNGSNHSRAAPELEAILASMSDALLVLDDQGCLVRLNQAARKLLCLADSTLILGHPVDQPQQGRWPLGTQELTEQLVPIIEQLKHGDAPTEEVAVDLTNDGRVPLSVACKASVLIKEGRPAGGVMLLREISRARAAA